MNLKEIAHSAGVSPSTVSLVRNHKGNLGIETRERLEKILQENGYAIADSSVCPKNICFLKFSRHSNLVNGNAGFVSAMIDAVEEETRLLGYNLLMTVVGENNLSVILDAIRTQPPDGIILLATELEREHLVYFQDLPSPIIVIDNYMDFENYNCVDMNNTEATFTAVNYLIDLGHPKIGYLYNNMPSGNCRARRCAFEAAVKRKNLPYNSSLIYPLHPTLSGSYEMTLRMLKSGVTFPSALVATNDSIAIGAVKAFKAYGLRVPQDVSVIGFDDIPFSAISDPPLTTLHISCKEIGVWAVRLLYDRMQNPDAPVMKMQVGATLVVRESTGRYIRRR